MAEDNKELERDDKLNEEAEAALKDEKENVSSEEVDKDSESNKEVGAEASEPKKEEESAEAKESERYMRLMAEFQNFKKRTAKEKSDIHAYGNEKLVGDLLPVLDNFERALMTNASDDPEGYAKGMKLIFDQMLEALSKAGVEEIKSEGEAFDPMVHNAVMTEDSAEHESGSVSKVLQKGYKLNGKVVRPSMVVVAN